MFSIMALKISSEGDKISRKTVSANAIIENMISPDHVLY